MLRSPFDESTFVSLIPPDAPGSESSRDLLDFDELTALERMQIKFVRRTFASAPINRVIRVLQRRFSANWIDISTRNLLHVHGVVDRTVPLLGLAYSPGLHSPLRPVSRTATMFGPVIEARLLPNYGHGWPTRLRGGFATTESGWAWLEAHRRRS